MTKAAGPRSAGSWIIVGSLAIVAATLGIVLASGLSLANAAGRPLDVPAVSVTPTSPATATPSSSPTASAPVSGHDETPQVVTAPPPVTVTLDDNHGDTHAGKDSGKSSGDDGGN